MDTIGVIELPGSTYLYALAFIAVAFVGFSSIALVIRQTLGFDLSRFEILLSRTYIEHGFLVVGFSLLPMLMILFEFPHSVALQLSSAAAGLGLIFWLGFFPRRFSRATARKLPLLAWAHFTIVAAAILCLFVNAAGLPTEPKVGLYALALTVLLVEALDTFLHSLNTFLRKPKEESASDEGAPR